MRALGASSWGRSTLAASAPPSMVQLPGELADGSYEVRVRATSALGDRSSLYTVPLRFPLYCQGEFNKDHSVDTSQSVHCVVP